MGIPPQTRDPVLLPQPTRQSVSYFGAVSLRDGRFLHRREEDRFNAVSFWAFLQGLWGRSQSPDPQVVLITDNASYHPARFHKDWRQEHECHFRLDFLRPYSPALNRMERNWKLTHRRCLRNR